MQRNVSPITAIVIILLALGIAALAWVRLSTGPKPMSEQERAGRRQGTSVRRGGGGGRRGGGGGNRGGGGGRRGGDRRGGEAQGQRGGGRQSGAAATQAKPGGVEESKGTATAGTAATGKGR